jgi:PAS domain S-box-containing protein
MAPQYRLLIFALFVSAAATGALGLYAWRHRRGQRGVLWFALLMFAAGFWSTATALEWASVDLSAQYFWIRVGWIGNVSMPVLWLLFAAAYTGRGQSLTKRTRLLLWVVPALSWILAWTNPWHHWVWSSVAQEPSHQLMRLVTVRGPWFFVHVTYSYALLVVGATLIVSALVRSPQRYRGQAGGLIIGLVAPWAANALYQFNLVTVDPTAFAFAITGAAFAWSIFRYRLLNIVPVAHDAVIRSLRDPVVVLNARQCVVDINPSAARLLGHTADEVVGEIGKTALSAWPAVVAQLAGASDGETEVSLPCDGATRPYTLRLSTLLDRSGHPSGRLLHLQDIEKHKQTEMALERSEQNLYAVVESLKVDAYFEADPSGTITYANSAFCKAVAYPREEVIGSHFSKFTAEESLRPLFRHFRALYQGDPPGEAVEYIFRKSDGSVGVAELSVSLVQVKDGQPLGTHGIVRDVTERKRAEEALQKAKEAAEEASRAKSTFLTNVSHELRTPLTSVLGFAKVIQKRLTEQIIPHVDVQEPKTERAVRQVQENLDIVVAESLRLTTLINDVLDVAKLESGQVEWQRRPVVVAEVIERAVAGIAAAAQQKGVSTRADIEPALPDLVGDQERLIQALVNLLSNAVKFTEPGGSITCTARRAGNEVVLSVIDTGIGIAPADCAKVFEPFVQVGDTLTDKPTGTGLGLPICKQIVEQHGGGRIWVESQPGRGSTFAFTLPIGPR